ncbi:MAG TPA: hypothetical protein VI193_02585 [Acidimicrobiia bacterium]
MERAWRRWGVLSVATVVIVLSPVARAESGGFRNYVPIAIAVGESDSVVVAKGDHLWSISAEHLEQRLARHPQDTEIGFYWHQVIEANRHRLRSGDPDLIYPGETVLLPEAG